MALVEMYHSGLLRLARSYVNTQQLAEDVVQETWVGLIRGIDRFEGRSSLKSWLFTILVNTARTRGKREARSIPFSSLWDPASEPGEYAVDPSRFVPRGQKAAGQWLRPPERWEASAEEMALSSETRSQVLLAVDELPPTQREVITLRDIEGWTASEVCNALAISETNQRVLLHRARSRVRAALEKYLERQ